MMSDYAAEAGFDPDDIDVEQDVVYDPAKEIGQALEEYRTDLRQELADLQRKKNRIDARLGIREYEAEERQIGEKAAYIVDTIYDSPFTHITSPTTLYSTENGTFWPITRSDASIRIAKHDSILRSLTGSEPRLTVSIYEDDDLDIPSILTSIWNTELQLAAKDDTQVYSALLDDQGRVAEIERFIPQDKTGPDWLDEINEMYTKTMDLATKQAIQNDQELQDMRDEIERLEDEIARVTEEERL